ncbi:glycosyltransferase, partial [Chloroflexota bacterium]
GYIDREKLLKYYQNATILVQPSYYEALPTTILEAMSCELPVVATSVGGIPEVVIDGETGLLVPAKDPENRSNASRRAMPPFTVPC